MDLFHSHDIEKLAAAHDLNGLYQLLTHHDPTTRLAAAVALADLDDGFGWRYLMEIVRTAQDPAEVADAAAALGDLGHPRAIPALEEALQRSRGETAEGIKAALEAIGGQEADAALRRAGYEPVVPHLTGLQLVDYQGGYVKSARPNTGEVEFLTAEQHYNNAADLREAELTEQALIEDSLALWLSPDWAEPWYLRGVIFEDLDRYYEAYLCYRYALELKPEHADAREALQDLEAEYGFTEPEEDLALINLDSRKWEQRRDAAAALGELGAEIEPQSFDNLLSLLDDEEREVRHAAIEALGNIENPRAVQPLVQRPESSWVLRFSIVEALAQLKSVEGLVQVLRDEMAGVQERNPMFSAEKDPLLQVEYERQMEIGVLAFEKTGDLTGLLALAEDNARAAEAQQSGHPAQPQADDMFRGAFGYQAEDESDESGDEEEAEEEAEEQLDLYVDEVALMVSLALERLALPQMAALDTPTLQRLAQVPDLTLLDITTGEDAAPTLVHDLSAVREAAKMELGKR